MQESGDSVSESKEKKEEAKSFSPQKEEEKEDLLNGEIQIESKTENNTE